MIVGSESRKGKNVEQNKSYIFHRPREVMLSGGCGIMSPRSAFRRVGSGQLHR